MRALTAAPNAAINVIASGEIAPGVAWPSVSPDGERVAFTVDIRGVTNVAVIGVDGSRMTLLGEGLSPAWSPDGKHIAFARSVAGKSHLFLVEADTGTGLVQLTSGPYDHDSPAWSPDGRFLVFATNRGADPKSGFRHLFIVGRDGTNLTQLTTGNTFNTTPSWSKDNWIYFSSDQAGNYDVWRLKPTGPWAQAAAAPAPVVSPTTPPTTPPAPETGSGGCTKDTDCKGNRICADGACVAPNSAGP